MRVLILDNSEVLLQCLIASLAQVNGIEIVGQAGTVGKALQAVRDLKPDVVILDIAMRGGSGLEVLESMRREGLKPVVIVLTNYAYPQYRKKCLQLGARFFFDKSREFERVGEVLQRLVHLASPETVEPSQETDLGRPHRIAEGEEA